MPEEFKAYIYLAYKLTWRAICSAPWFISGHSDAFRSIATKQRENILKDIALLLIRQILFTSARANNLPLLGKMALSCSLLVQYLFHSVFACIFVRLTSQRDFFSRELSFVFVISVPFRENEIVDVIF